MAGPPPKKPLPGAAPKTVPANKPPPGGKPKPPGAPKDVMGVGAKGPTRLSTGSIADRQNAAIAEKSGQAPADKGKAAAAAPAAPPPTYVEDKFLQQSWAKSVAVPTAFNEFIQRVLPAFKFEPTTLHLLQVFSNTDERAVKVKGVLESNPYYRAQFLRHVENNRGGRADAPSVDSAIVLLGMENSRSFLASLQLQRTVMGGHVEWTKDGKLAAEPNSFVGFALRTDEALAERKDAYSNSAFSAGLVFDYLAQAVTKYAADPKKAGQFVDQVFAHGMKTAKVGMLLADQVPDFNLKKYVFAACLLHDVGKLILAILAQDYVDFYDETRKRDLPRAVRQFAEEKRFGVGHPMLSAMVCRATGVHQPVEQAVFFHHNPIQLFRAGNRHAYTLSSLVCLASNVANQLRKPEGPNDPVYDKWLGPELKGFTVKKEAVAAASEKILRSGD
ncbi:MAG TPA: HDOD domain-containing protein [Bdellovibrionota bacterium]|nr:HDOD domain-containing protein [Bdellovibrionota bacterium]